MSREFFNQFNEKVAKDELDKYDRDIKWDIQAERKDPKLEYILKKVDFDILEGVFEDVIGKYGVVKKNMNFLRPDMISHSCIGKGQYRTETNAIGLNYFEIMKKIDGVNPELEILKHLCHEETHAISDNKCIGLKTFESEKPKPGDKYRNIEKSGYSQVIKTGQYNNSETQESKRIFEYFNEGVVEKLSKEIFINYLDRDKEYISAEEKNKYREKRLNKVAYDRDVRLVDALIYRISKEVEINQEEVWQSFVKGLVVGDEFNDKDIQDWFNEMFSDDFLKRLARYKTQEEYEDLMEEIKIEAVGKNNQQSIKENKFIHFLKKMGLGATKKE